MPSSNEKQQWFILAIRGDTLSDAITQNHLPPVCFVTTQHLKHTRKGRGGRGGGLRYEFGDFQELGLYCFLGQGEHVHMPFFCFVDFCLTLTYEYIYYIYITLNIMFLVNCNQITF